VRRVVRPAAGAADRRRGIGRVGRALIRNARPGRRVLSLAHDLAAGCPPGWFDIRGVKVVALAGVISSTRDRQLLSMPTQKARHWDETQ
jgi:hypothetical protein